MAETLAGYSQLQARFRALAGPQKMRLVAAVASGELRMATPRKTGVTGASWQVGAVSDAHASVTGSIVNLWLDAGTGLYGPMRRVITPQAKRALAFHAGTYGKGGSLRLSGSPRAGKAGAAASLVVVRSVKGMKPRPFIARALAAAGGKLGTDVVYKVWNDAA